MQTGAVENRAKVIRSNAWLPAAQWLAVLSMTLEHVTRYI